MGLGNRLLPWARCKLFSLGTGTPMLAPDWFQWKLGPILRRESDWRMYGNLFRPVAGEIRGLRKRYLLARLPRVPEPATGEATPGSAGEGAIVEFSGLRDYFGPMLGHREILKRELVAMVRQEWLSASERAPAGFIGLHVRRGDFAVPASAEELKTRGGIQTPIDWFVGALALIRRVMGRNAPARIVSDGRTSDLQPLLNLPETTLVQTGSAIGDLLFLSRADVLVGSGGSSFSAWASYLGGMPTVTVEGQPLGWFQLRPDNGAFVGELGPGDPPAALLQQLAQMKRHA